MAFAVFAVAVAGTSWGEQLLLLVIAQQAAGRAGAVGRLSDAQVSEVTPSELLPGFDLDIDVSV
jgi:hypothetical protein